ncbi:cupin domain-containing protein [Brevibacterium sp. UMB1308A]|uniref:cupin domain-containing protein n=1 Tax=Brevibacterium sp. UMB1308A TaxID=3050608 RepID=UPI002550B286|nr:cupin domain-containing protein [Brevibacterium sp. UMB1308A]MDK8346295.1 cupin domain-containing protein [Brevibacterium sp. UMB1308B]MDK8712465.1 cupin domain-containing protein [Brevibacterium sp. UMB1308A]
MAEIKDNGPNPYAVNIEELTLENENFRTALWTGEEFQVTLMEIPVGGDVGLEVHTENDQFLRLEQGKGLAKMGPAKDNFTFEQEVSTDWAVIVPKGVWHNIVNIGDEPMKLYSIYAPAHHPHGTVHKTQAEAEEAEAHEH